MLTSRNSTFFCLMTVKMSSLLDDALHFLYAALRDMSRTDEEQLASVELDALDVSGWGHGQGTRRM
jgi:hypothetical protein